MFRLSSLALAGLVAFLTLGGVTAAQCPSPDHLDGGPCCALATPNLPKLPNFQQDALEICWRDCNVNQVLGYRARWSSLNFAPSTGVPCGERLMRLDLYNAVGTLQWTGNLRLQYSRTWLETDPAGFPVQVWRFLVNGDMRPIASLLIPCPVPGCVPANGNRARFSGYVDYATSCAILPAIYQQAWMLTHACDFIDHQAGFPRAGVFHPDRSYTFVGPAAGFMPGPIQPVEGTPGSPFEAMRRRNLPVPGTTGPTTCNFEERAQFNLLPTNQFCLCGPIAAPQQWLLGNLNVFGSCGSNVSTPGAPLLPGYLSMGIGTWTIPGVYPGVEALRWNAGGYNYVDPCPGLVSQEVFFGVTTIGGYPAMQLVSTGVGAALPLTFIDQSNSLMPPFGGTIMNVPYVSDHILNLNH